MVIKWFNEENKKFYFRFLRVGSLDEGCEYF